MSFQPNKETLWFLLLEGEVVSMFVTEIWIL